jgi:hypothetical protein
MHLASSGGDDVLCAIADTPGIISGCVSLLGSGNADAKDKAVRVLSALLQSPAVSQFPPAVSVQGVLLSVLEQQAAAGYEHGIIKVLCESQKQQRIAPDVALRHLQGFIEQQARDKVCNTCGQSPAKKCAACQTVRYCNNQCVAAHWKQHQPVCKAIIAALGASP